MLSQALGIVFAALALASTPAHAQSAATLKEAVERAVLRNPEVKFKHHNVAATAAEQDVARGGWRPTVDFEAGSGRESTLTPAISASRNYTHSLASIQLRQTLFDGFATQREVRRLGYSRQAAYYDLLATSDQIGLDAARAYIDVQRYRELVVLAKNNYASHADVHAKLGSRVAAGVGRRVDLEQAAGRMALAESNWLTEVSNLHDVTARYQRLTGELPADTLAAVPELDKLMPERSVFLPEAIRKNPEFLGAVANLRANRADAEVRRAEYSPKLELRASQRMDRDKDGIAGNYRDSALQMVLSFNLYRGGSDSARVNQYVAKMNAAFELRDKACRDIRQTAQIAFNDVSRLRQQLGFLAQHELSTSKAREAYRQQFDIGQRSLLDLLDTENELYQARRALAAAEFDLHLARLRVLAASGSLLPALQLRALEAELPADDSDAQPDDALLQCSTELPPVMTLEKDKLPPVDLTPPPAPVPRSPVAAVADDCSKTTAAIEVWSAAWNRRDLAAYMASYSDKFVPPQGMKYAAWAKLRKQRLSQNSASKAILSDIKTVSCAQGSAELSFTQTYGSVDHSDIVEKTLSMELVRGQWKITRETVTKGRTY
jgi:adhesin transport system outer membrane protein